MKANPSVTELESQFEVLFAAIEKYFRLRGFEANTAADLTAEVFERSLQARNGYDPRRASLKTWLFAIAHNLLVNAWKAAQNPAAAPSAIAEELADHDPLPEERVMQVEGRQELLTALQNLDGREREVVSLKFSGRLTNREIGGLLSISAGNVGVILYRALKQIKADLSKGQSEVKDE